MRCAFLFLFKLFKKKRTKTTLNNGGTISDVESHGEGGGIYIIPLWQTEQASELIRRCDLSPSKYFNVGSTLVLG